MEIVYTKTGMYIRALIGYINLRLGTNFRAVRIAHMLFPIKDDPFFFNLVNKHANNLTKLFVSDGQYGGRVLNQLWNIRRSATIFYRDPSLSLPAKCK